MEEQGLEEKLEDIRTKVKVATRQEENYTVEEFEEDYFINAEPEKEYTITTAHYVINKEIKFDDKKTIIDIIKENSGVMKEIILDIDEKIKKNNGLFKRLEERSKELYNSIPPFFIITYIKEEKVNVFFDLGLEAISDYCSENKIPLQDERVLITTIDVYKDMDALGITHKEE
ncbi:hypothetical protein B6U93_04410 [Candidatus Woesearchaeota archaeon ex4484_78]|nr:MAG: hypothetical protein B6U93_04410 [Candidatus Woesearchaeota archaeon ex4484_78]